MVLDVDGVQQVEETLEMIIVRLCIGRNNIVQHMLFQGSTESKDTSTQQRLDDIGTEGMVNMFVEAQTEHFIEIGIELQV